MLIASSNCSECSIVLKSSCEARTASAKSESHSSSRTIEYNKLLYAPILIFSIDRNFQNTKPTTMVVPPDHIDLKQTLNLKYSLEQEKTQNNGWTREIS